MNANAYNGNPYWTGFTEAEYQKAAQAAAEGFGSPEEVDLKPGERLVDDRMRNEMIVRRCGNICQAAASQGWKVLWKKNSELHYFLFKKGGVMMPAWPHPNPRQALVVACETLEKFLLH